MYNQCLILRISICLGCHNPIEHCSDDTRMVVPTEHELQVSDALISDINAEGGDRTSHLNKVSEHPKVWVV